MLGSIFLASPIASAGTIQAPDSVAQRTSDANGKAQSAPATGHAATPLKASATYDVQSDASFALSPSASRVSQIASQNGDRRFILVDKARGRIVLFLNGKPAFVRAALTGESLEDQLPSDAMEKSISQHIGTKYKVTPAGRFTVSRAHDEALGDTLDINELQGSDWMISVHQAWLGIRSQHRDTRLRSDDDRDKHITEGCIDVDPSTIALLLQLLPNANGTAIYISPMDDRLIKTLFQPHPTVSARNSSPG